VKDNSGIDTQVHRTGGNMNLNGNKVYYVIVKIWICIMYWNHLGCSSPGQNGPFDNPEEYSTRFGE
jgi:hypothetical protein